MNEDVLKSGFNEFLLGGLEEEQKARFRLATTAYFKALSQLCDLLLLRKLSKIPSNHTDRFRLLENCMFPVYQKTSDVFNVYRKTYSAQSNKDSCLKIKNEIKEIIRLANLENEFAETLQKL